MHTQGMNYRGNILFIILLAVVLFAGLSYAVTQSMRGSGKGAGTENAKLFASQLFENSALMENVIMRAMLVNGIPEYGFDFYKGSAGGFSAANATCTVSACKIFQSNGGTVPYITVPPEFQRVPDYLIYPHFRVFEIQQIGTTAPDLLVQYFVNQELCEALNEELGYEDIDLITPPESYSGSGYFYSGTKTSFPTSGGIIGDDNINLVGKHAACYKNGSNFIFYYVLLAR